MDDIRIVILIIIAIILALDDYILPIIAGIILYLHKPNTNNTIKFK